MEPKKDTSDFDLDSPDLEVFSSAFSVKDLKKNTKLVDLLNKSYTKTTLTLTLLFFLFASTFFIASRISKPAFLTSKADVGYLPKAEIDIPKTKFIRSCSDVNIEADGITFLKSYCRGDWCSYHIEKDKCESTDVVFREGEFLSEISKSDGIPDCVWVEEESSCKPKY